MSAATLTRRQFLRSGWRNYVSRPGPQRTWLFAADHLKPLSIPTFTALPYIQPGPEGH